jgi:hypothetical protein
MEELCLERPDLVQPLAEVPFLGCSGFPLFTLGQLANHAAQVQKRNWNMVPAMVWGSIWKPGAGIGLGPRPCMVPGQRIGIKLGPR